MGEHKATFEIESKADAYAVERLMNRVYDLFREESQTVREGSGDSTEMIEQFQSIRTAARQPTAGRLTVILEQEDETLEE